MNTDHINIPMLVPGILGTTTLFVATWAFGIGWLATVWAHSHGTIPNNRPWTSRSYQCHSLGLANFAVTFLTPIMFNNLRYYIFLVFAASNAFAGVWTWIYLPESGNRSFEDNQKFFEDAAKEGSWRVAKVDAGRYLKMPYGAGEDAERTPLLQRVGDQITL